MQKDKIILVFGATASGKTSLGINLAQKFNGEIINADSRQFYKNMPIITAMPSADEFTQAPHHLFEILNPEDDFSVADFLKLANIKIQEIISRNKTPIIVGGTGLYLKALEQGLSPIPSIDKQIVDELNELDSQQLYTILKNEDNDAAQALEENDRQRIIRAISVIRSTGKSLTQWRNMPNEGALDLEFIKLAINPPREILYDRINQRANKMLDTGLVEEISILANTYNNSRINSLTSIGFDIFFDYFNSKIELENAINLFSQKQRNYAKRQLTWLKTQYKAHFIHENIEDTFNYVSDKIKKI